MGKRNQSGSGGGSSKRCGEGPPCFRCGVPTARLEHTADWKPEPNRWYLRYWWRCLNGKCRTQQINPKERAAWVWSGPDPEPQAQWVEQDANDTERLFKHLSEAVFGADTDGKPPWED